jgi:hypothetical protein
LRRKLSRWTKTNPRLNDLNDFARNVARVPERVPLLSRLQHPGSWFSRDDVVAQQSTIFAMVTMQRCRQRARRQLMMDYGEAAAGLRAVNLPLCAEPASVSFFTRLKRNQ